MPEIDDELLKIIGDRIEVAVKDRFSAVQRQMDSIQKTLDILSGDLEEDRKSLTQIRIDLSAVTQEVKELVAGIHTLPRKIGEKVAEKADQVLETASEKASENVEPAMARAMKKIKKGLPLKENKIWWRRLLRW